MKYSGYWETDGEPDIEDNVEPVELTQDESTQATILYTTVEELVDTLFAEDGCVTETSIETFPDIQLVRVSLTDHLYGDQQPFYLTATTDFNGNIVSILLNRPLDQTLLKYPNGITPSVYYRQKSVDGITEKVQATEIVTPKKLQLSLDIVHQQVSHYLETRKTPGIPLSIPHALDWLLNSSNLALKVGNEPIMRHDIKTLGLVECSTQHDMDRIRRELQNHRQYLDIQRVPAACFYVNTQDQEKHPGEPVSSHMVVNLDEEGNNQLIIDMGSLIEHQGSRRFWSMKQRYVMGNLQVVSHQKVLWALSRDDISARGSNQSRLEVLPQRRSQGTNRELPEPEQQPISIADVLLSIVNRQLVNSR